jgi:hypothetical protein
MFAVDLLQWLRVLKILSHNHYTLERSSSALMTMKGGCSLANAAEL